jgi:hypothetical protein
MPNQVTFDATEVEQGDYTTEIIVLSKNPVTPSASIPVTITVVEPHWDVHLPLFPKNSQLVICKVIAAPENILWRCIGCFSVH